MASLTIHETEFSGLRLLSRGKVRDIYDFGDQLLMVASDRLSAFDVVLPTPIPDKGRVLTQLSLFWFDFLKKIVSNHLIIADVKRYPAQAQPYGAELAGRSMLVKKLEMVPIECVVRGYISGSAWKEYRQSGSVCGIRLPAGLRESDRFPQPIFTPSTKATTGHDENISLEQTEKIVGRETAQQLEELSLRVYSAAAQYAETRGIILADTKFEFGRERGKSGGPLILADEVLTPDSSRFWPQANYSPARAQESFDKQYVRDYLERLGWNKRPPAPALPPDVVRQTSEKYREAYRKLTGSELPH